MNSIFQLSHREVSNSIVKYIQDNSIFVNKSYFIVSGLGFVSKIITIQTENGQSQCNLNLSQHLVMVYTWLFFYASDNVSEVSFHDHMNGADVIAKRNARLALNIDTDHIRYGTMVPFDRIDNF